MDTLVEIARKIGLSYNSKGEKMRRADLEDHFLKAQTFAASVRSKYPSTFERGASARGDWWGFLGDYEVLECRDLEAEATFCGVPLTYRTP